MKRKPGRPTKATPARIEAVLADLAKGMPRELACAHNGCSEHQWIEWERKPEFPQLRARAVAARMGALLKQLDETSDPVRMKSVMWLLERVKVYGGAFTDPTEKGIHLHQNNLVVNSEELERARTILDKAKQLPYRNENDHS